jgi:uncharacterized membrane protein
MEAYLFDWLNLFFRWFHVIAGVAWIGASFYFIWLDLSLREPPEHKKEQGIKGDLWAIHGGGFYEVAKYQAGPPQMPSTLHWFKWEAYTTWLTGFALLSVMYYWGAEQYLIDPQKVALGQWQAIGISLAFLAGGFAVYEALLKSPLRQMPKLFAALLYSALVLAAWALDQIFSDRAAYLHVGALIGSIMAGNVLFGIMPAQRELVRAVTAGETPQEHFAELAKLRSTHNNYFTLPLIFIMISNHYPMTYGHEQGWLVLAFIGAISAFARHYFNLKHQDNHQPWILVVAALALFALIGWMLPKPAQPLPESSERVSQQQAMALVTAHCSACHAAKPSHAAFNAPPGGIELEQWSQVTANAARIIPALRTGYMPLGNTSGMTEEQRAQLIQALR